jgi:hypothetical protein
VRVPSTAATIAPALEPEMTFGSTPCSNSALATPKWKNISVPPLLIISAVRP